jgi:hypothetical protein
VSAARFLAELERLGVDLTLDGDRLRVGAPAGVLSPALRAELGRRKPEIVSRLRAPAGIPRVGRERREAGVPLSYAQQRLWVLHRLDPESSFYNCPIALRVRGPVDPAVLEGALREVVRRHETLRTRFVESGGTPVQVVSGDPGFRLATADLTKLPAGSREGAMRRAVGREAQRPFDLGRDLLLRALLVKVGDDDHAVLLVLHHIVCDGWSMGLLLSEVGRLYGDLAAGWPPALSEPPVQYADFAVWQRDWLSGERLEGQVAYWVERLAGAPPLLELPTDRPRPPVQRFRGGSETRRLPAALGEGARALGRRYGASLFMTLLAAFEALLHGWTGSADLCIGSPVAGRNRSEVEGLIGFFANMLVLRIDLSGDPTFPELLGRVRETAFAAFARPEVPFDLLVEKLRPDRDSRYSPLVQVAFDLQESPPLSPAFDGLTLEPLGTDSATSQFDLVLNAEDGPDGLTVCFDYDSDLFDAATVVRAIDDLEAVLERVVAEPEVRLGHLAAGLAARREERRAEREKSLEQARLAKFRSVRRRRPTNRMVEEGL